MGNSIPLQYYPFAARERQSEGPPVAYAGFFDRWSGSFRLRSLTAGTETEDVEYAVIRIPLPMTLLLTGSVLNCSLILNAVDRAGCVIQDGVPSMALAIGLGHRIILTGLVQYLHVS